jgi:hemerythrin
MATVYVAWKEIYSVGDPTIDGQHKQILSAINELHAANMSGGGQMAMKGILDRIVNYTHSHFTHEENIMKACGYPDLANHQEQHDQMRRRTENMRENTKLITGNDLERMLKDWWTKHIQAEDQCYVPYLSAAIGKGVKLPSAATQPVGQMNWGGQTPTYR